MKPELFIDTDVLAYALSREGEELFGRLATFATLFTSVLNATELLASVRSDEETAQAEKLLGSVHVLGFHQRYARRFAALANGDLDPAHLRNCMVAGSSLEARLPLLSLQPQRYAAFTPLSCIHADDVRDARSWKSLEAHIALDTAESGRTGEHEPEE